MSDHSPTTTTTTPDPAQALATYLGWVTSKIDGLLERIDSLALRASVESQAADQWIRERVEKGEAGDLGYVALPRHQVTMDTARLHADMVAALAGGVVPLATMIETHTLTVHR